MTEVYARLTLVQYGRNSLGDITREVDGKSEEEVRAYSKTFWRRYKELTDWERVIKNIGARPPGELGTRVRMSAVLETCISLLALLCECGCGQKQKTSDEPC